MSSEVNPSVPIPSRPRHEDPAWWDELWRAAAAQPRPAKEFLLSSRAIRAGDEEGAWPWSARGSDAYVLWFYDGLRAAADVLLARRGVLASDATPFLDVLSSEASAHWLQEQDAHRQAASTDPEAYERIGARLIAIGHQLAEDCTLPGPVALAADWLLSAGQRLLLEMADPPQGGNPGVHVLVRLVEGADDAPVRALGTVLWSSALLPLLHLALDPADVPRLQALPAVAAVEWPKTGSTQGTA